MRMIKRFRSSTFAPQLAILAGISAALHKRDPLAFYLLLAAFGLGVVGCLVTILFNVPVNKQLAIWNPSALPVGYELFLRRWWQWHQVRLVTMFTAMCLVFVAMLVRK